MNVDLSLITNTKGPLDLDGIRENPHTHLIIGAQFGDLEFDVGKTVPWASQYFSDVFIADVNTGKPRYWVIDWSEQSPKAKHTSLPSSFFTNAALWRKAQFEAADAAWKFDDNDWVFFMDATECLSTDESNTPDDVGASPYKSWIDREIQRAKDADNDFAFIPFFIFLRDTDQSHIRYRFMSEADVAAINYADQNMDPNYGYAELDVAKPYYLPYGALMRLAKVSMLRDPLFDWTDTYMDTPTEAPMDVKVQIISYAYASWKPLDYDTVNHTGVVEGEDLGLKMRALISQVRPVIGLGTGSTMPAEEVYGPYVTSDGIDLTVVPGEGQAAVLTTPAYPTSFRKNLRDGVHYFGNERGNVPMMWDLENSQWVPALDPYDWKSAGSDPTLFTQG